MTQLVLYAHGSRDPRWRASFEGLAGEVGATLAYLELSGPTLDEVIDRAAAAGASRVRVLPLFLAVGKHMSEDVGARVAAAGARHPGVAIELLPAVGEDERVRAALRQVVREAAADG
jgi:sirohydrochlorin cobaltochelatase